MADIANYTDEETQAIFAWIQRTFDGGTPTCPICHNASGVGIGLPIMPFALDTNGIAVPDTRPPGQMLLPLECQRCHYQMYFPLSTIGPIFYGRGRVIQ